MLGVRLSEVGHVRVVVSGKALKYPSLVAGHGHDRALLETACDVAAVLGLAV